VLEEEAQVQAGARAPPIGSKLIVLRESMPARTALSMLPTPYPSRRWG
jgi:hypothetical protein